ncbi:MAG TPA: amidase [Chthoniobacteraceae bacterium]|nr:amidase [Chthoniobacteraceae bacterium]
MIRKLSLAHRLLILAPLLCFCSCSMLPQWNARRPGSRAFITPLRCDAEQGRLRLAVKDNIDVEGVVTTAGSGYLAATRPPAARDAPCLAIARERRVQIIGKTNLSEFAVSPSGVNEYYGTPRNPFCFWSKRIPGGSSSGSAVAVAGGMADVAFGTDTAGSVRVPAACCGIVGLKTTHGLVSVDGVFPVEPEHLDTVGPMGKDIASTVVGMDLLQRGFLARYAAAKAARPAAGAIKVGRLHLNGTDPKIDEALDQALKRAGFQVIPLEAGLAEKWDRAKQDGNAMAASGAWISDKQYRNTLGVALRTKVVILAGRLNYATKYPGALARRGAWQATLDDTFKKVDFIAVPTLQRAPLRIPPNIDAGLLEAQVLKAQNTSPVNYAGNPALVVPVPLHGAGFSVTSLQLIGPKLSEPSLLNAGRFVEDAVHRSTRGTSYERLATACASETDSAVLRH